MGVLSLLLVATGAGFIITHRSKSSAPAPSTTGISSDIQAKSFLDYSPPSSSLSFFSLMIHPILPHQQFALYSLQSSHTEVVPKVENGSHINIIIQHVNKDIHVKMTGNVQLKMAT